MNVLDEVDELYTNEEPEILQLLKNNRKWIEDNEKSDPDFYKRIGDKQRPQYL